MTFPLASAVWLGCLPFLLPFPFFPLFLAEKGVPGVDISVGASLSGGPVLTQDGQEDGGKANYLGDLQRACPIISKYVTYFETRDLPTKGRDQANILSIADDLDLENNNTLVRRYTS